MSITYYKLFCKDKNIGAYHNQANTNIEKNVPFLHKHINYCSIYLFTGHICDAGKVEIICAIRADSQLKMNVLQYDILHSTFSK